MKNSSRKAKGRYLQNIVKQKIINLYPVLGADDIRTSMSSEHGADIKLTSQTARKLFSYSIECKNRQDFKQLYNHYKQAARHTNLEPLLIVKMNREKPLAIIDLDHLIELQKNDI
tara:strand:- start:183 stop:527 length:345 start_codon:yes stop_codon:yes gene_type:complete